MIVVGIDGSDGSRSALAWAVEEARLRNDRVLAVHVWSPPSAYAPAPWAVAVPADEEAFERSAEELVRDVVAEVVGDDAPPVEARAVRGSPAGELLRLAGDEHLLVVGSRGHGGFAGLLLGSVSDQCAHHARGPVVLVPARPD
jgi:nucleotide-binding universal stress UspA family protein